MKKRIALAAVAALAGGLLVAAPASAVSAANQPFKVLTAVSSSTGSSSAETATATAGALNFVELGVTGTGDTVTAGGTLVVTGGTFSYNNVGTLSADAKTITFSSTSVANGVFRIPTPTVGTITVVYSSFAAPSGIGAFTTQQTFTITVSAAAAAAAYNHTKVSAFEAFDTTYGYLNADGVLFASKALASATVPETRTAFTVKQYSSTDETTELTGGSTLAKAVTVSLSGVGVISDGTNNNVTYLAVAGGSYAAKTIKVSSDGRSGNAVVTVAVDGVVVATKTVTFYGAVAKYTASVNHAQINATGSMTLTVKAVDASGIAVPALGYTALVDDTATGLTSVNADTVVGVDTFTVTSASKYARTITIGNGSAETATVVANFVTNDVKTNALSADKASYAPGDKATFSFSLKNSDGVVVGDGNYAITWLNSGAIYSLPNSVDIVNGAGSITGYMPVSSGPVVVSATIGGVAATLNLAVVDPAATAQAAAITALQTSVATLTTTVASLVASMTAQIKVINATMLKIQKQLAALRLQVNKL